MESRILGVNISPAIMNASGVRDTTKEELEALAKSDAGAVVVKSATILPRDGNPDPKWGRIDNGIIQSIGLANPGYLEYVELIPWLKSLGKPVIQSIAGFTVGEYATMAEAFVEADLLEINLGCPNTGKAVGGYDPQYAGSVAKAVLDITDKVLFKLPPYLDACLQARALDALGAAGAQALTLVNSAGNCCSLAPGGPAISAVWGGLSGPALKPLAIGNILRASKHGSFEIIGVGGISSPWDLEEFGSAGAKAFQIGYTLATDGVSAFKRFL